MGIDANKSAFYACIERENKELKEQLRVKEQENEKLKVQLMQKSEVDMFFNSPVEGWNNDPCKICTYKQNYQAKEQEYERLKKQYNCNACGTCDGREDYLNLSRHYTNLRRHYEKAVSLNHKYKPALDEIREIARNDCDNCAECTTEFNLKESCSIYEIIDIINNANFAPTTIFDKIRIFTLDDFAKFIHSLIKCSEKPTCDDCYIATLPFPKRICDTKETLSDIQNWLKEKFKEQ